jgi:hypothetical protein
MLSPIGKLRPLAAFDLTPLSDLDALERRDKTNSNSNKPLNWLFRL